MIYQTNNVFEAVWMGAAIMSYKRYLGLNTDEEINRESFWFSQSEIQQWAQKYCKKTVQSARVSQWANGDHRDSSYNFLRENGKSRRLTAPGEYKGVREFPEELTKHKESVVSVGDGTDIKVSELIEWVNSTYRKLVFEGITNPVSTQTPAELEINQPSISVTAGNSAILDLKHDLEEFLNKIKVGEIEIYNEYSVQFELAIFLRNRLDNSYKIQLERNINYFGLNKGSFIKKEMDIVIFNSSEKYCIELKFPVNGQYPEQMFSICKDIKFLEELKRAGFTKAFQLVIVNSDGFYIDKGGSQIYEMFRKNKLLEGTVIKPTGKKDEEFTLDYEYKINWIDLDRDLKGFIVTV